MGEQAAREAAANDQEIGLHAVEKSGGLVELSGIEPLTSAVRLQRSPI